MGLTDQMMDMIEAKPMPRMDDEENDTFIYEKRDLEILNYNLGHIANILKCETGDLQVLPLSGAFGLALPNLYKLYTKNLKKKVHNVHNWIRIPANTEIVEFTLPGNKISFVIIVMSDFEVSLTDNLAMVYKKGELLPIARQSYNFKLRSFDASIPILHEDQIEMIMDNTIDFIKNAKKLSKFQVPMSNSIILHGSPGCGKTMMMKYIKAICIKNKLKFKKVTSADIHHWIDSNCLEKKFNAYNVYFFDDVDIAYFSREKNPTIAGELLSAMDGLDNKANTICRIFSTNETISNLDPAFLRPGRIDRVIELKKPDPELRRIFIGKWHKEIKSGINIEDCVDKTDGLSFAEMELVKANLVNNFFKEKEWDLDYALENVKIKTESSKRIGFGK